MFNDPIAAERFAWIQANHKFQTCIETGTHLGCGALHLSKYRSTVCTIEVNSAFRIRAFENFLCAGYTDIGVNSGEWVFQRDGDSIHSFGGNSPEVLRGILSRGQFLRPFLFYLDAHWNEYWPILDELKVIADFGLSDSFIIIHDFQVPGKPFGFDTYGDQPLNYDYVKNELAAINPHFKIFYNDRACEGPAGRGILYAAGC